MFPGASGGSFVPSQLDTPLDFDAMRAAGSGLGSGGFVVYDDSACIVAATLAFSRFLSIESCAQCPACKHGAGEITEAPPDDRGRRSGPRATTLGRCWPAASSVTGAPACALPTGESLLVTRRDPRVRGRVHGAPRAAVPLPRGAPRPEARGLRRTIPALHLRPGVPPEAARLDLRPGGRRREQQARGAGGPREGRRARHRPTCSAVDPGRSLRDAARLMTSTGSAPRGAGRRRGSRRESSPNVTSSAPWPRTWTWTRRRVEDLMTRRS